MPGNVPMNTCVKFIFHTDNKDSDQTALMRRQIRVFVGLTYQKVRVFMLRLYHTDMQRNYYRDQTWFFMH